VGIFKVCPEIGIDRVIVNFYRESNLCIVEVNRRGNSAVVSNGDYAVKLGGAILD
jgi:hypothetical protein